MLSLLVLWCLVLLALAVPRLGVEALGSAAPAPDVWLLVVLYLAFRGRGSTAVPWAIGLGAVRDALSLDPLGTHAFVLGTTAWFFSEGRRPRGRLDGMPRLLLTVAGAVLAGWLYLVRLLPLGGGLVAPRHFVAVLPAALWTTLFAAALFPLLDHGRLLDDLCGRRRGLPA